MKTNAHTSQIQELDREFQPEGYKTEIKEGRLKNQAKNPQEKEQVILFLSQLLVNSRKDIVPVASRRIWLLNVQSSKVCQIRNSLQSSEEINFVTIVSRDHISQDIVRKTKESCEEQMDVNYTITEFYTENDNQKVCELTG